MLRTIRTLACDLCGTAGPSGRTVEIVRSLAEVAGWSRLVWRGDEYHLCPTCLDGMPEIEPPRGQQVLPMLHRLFGVPLQPMMPAEQHPAMNGGHDAS